MSSIAIVISATPAVAAGATGSVGSWTTSSHHVPTSISGGASVTYNGYTYIIGGSSSTGGTWLDSVYYAKLNSDGSTSAWITNSTVLPQGSYYPSATVSNGYIYVMGGYGGSFQTSVYYAKINSDGSVGAWTTSSNSLPQGLYEGGSVTHNGYIYYIGGLDSGSSFVDTTYFAKQNADGSIGVWSTSTSHLPQGVGEAGVTLANGRVYVVGGGGNSGYLHTTYYASLNSDGSVGAWTTSTTTLPQVLDGPALATSNGYLYAAGGTNNTADQDTVYYAKLNADGSIPSWATSTNTLPQPLLYSDATVLNGYLYVMAGQDDGDTQDTVYSAPLNFTSQESIANPIAGNTVSLTTPAGTHITTFSEAASSTTDTGYTYPLGLSQFSFITDNASNQITLTFQTSLKPTQVTARKYNSTTRVYTTIPGAVVVSTTLNGQPALSLTYTITDGGTLDQDGVVNGTITDPVGLAVANSPAIAAPNTGFGEPQSNNTALLVASAWLIILVLGVRLLATKRPR